MTHDLGKTMLGFAFCICPMIVSTMMTTWKWSLVKIILDGYPLIEHLVAFNETHISNVDDVGVVGVKKKKIPFIKGREVQLILKVPFLELRKCCQRSLCVM